MGINFLLPCVSLSILTGGLTSLTFINLKLILYDGPAENELSFTHLDNLCFFSLEDMTAP